MRKSFLPARGPSEWKEKGILLRQMVRPLERVGIYVPGGKASYPSTVLMAAIPAKVAGVKEIIMTLLMKMD
jgi:histidinol dehydrogenase